MVFANPAGNYDASLNPTNRVSVFGDAGQKQKTLAMLEGQKSFVRQTLGHNIRLKFTPSIVFYLDETMDNAMNLERIFRKIHKDESTGS